MKMKAAALHEQGRPRPYVDSKPMTIEEVDLDPPGPGEVLYTIDLTLPSPAASGRGMGIFF